MRDALKHPNVDVELVNKGDSTNAGALLTPSMPSRGTDMLFLRPGI